jgi:hypothetical protein
MVLDSVLDNIDVMIKRISQLQIQIQELKKEAHHEHCSHRNRSRGQQQSSGEEREENGNQECILLEEICQIER